MHDPLMLAQIRSAVGLVDFVSKTVELKPQGDDFFGLCPFHQESTPSFSITPENGLFYCHGCRAGGDIFSFVRQKHRVGFSDAVKILAIEAGIELDSAPQSAEYIYLNADSQNHLRVKRYYKNSKKCFAQSHWDGSQWVSGSKGIDRVLYRLPEVLSSELVLIVEGEKDCETARNFGLEARIGAIATTSPGGATKWVLGAGERWLKGKQVVIIPDRDEAGDLHCRQVLGDVPWAKVLKLPQGKDLTEYLCGKGTIEELSRLIEEVLSASDRNGLEQGTWMSDRNGHEGNGDERSGDELSAKFNEEVKSRTSTEPEKKKSHFESSPKEGLKYIKITYDKQAGQEVEEITYVGNHLIALASARSPHDDGYQIQVELKNRNGLKTLTIPKVLIEGEGKEALELLVDNGYSYCREARKLLLGYLSRLGNDVDQEYIISSNTGWVNNAFVLPDRSFGNDFLRFQKVELPKILEYEEKGTLEEWKNNVAIKAQLNSRLTFALGVSFSAPLNPILNVESGGWHFFGATSGGKTATLKFAASVYGAPKRRISSWRTTSNSLEYKCVAHNHLTLFLDEVGQALPQDVAASAYMISNGQGKNRMTRHLTQREVPRWETVFFSTGEHTLTSYLEQGGIKTKGGQENRMPSIPICPKDGINSAFESFHGLDPIEFVSELEENADKYTGTAFSAFMNYLVSNRNNEYDAKLVSRHTEIRNELVATHEQSNVLLRVADRMAVVQLGLEIASEANLIPSGIKPGMVKIVFDDWVRCRGGSKDFELMRQCEKIKDLFVANEFSDRIAVASKIDFEGTSDRIIRNLLAYKINNGFLVPASVFRSLEFAGEVDLKILTNELISRKWLTVEENSEKRQTVVKKIGGKNIRGYLFSEFWAELED